jgi:NADPH:quinone reductase-like Zn-dependent oxidoreductase
MIFFIVGALVLYALVGYLRRKYTVANYSGKTVWITGGSSGIG